MKFIKYSLVVTSLLLLATACKEEVQEKKEILRPVKFEIAGNSSLLKIRSFTGTAKAGDAIELSFRANGIVTTLNAEVGSSVKKGQIIAKLDNVQASLAYEQSVSALNSARSGLNTAQASVDRIRSLYEKGSKSLSEYESAKNSYQTALDQFESAKRNKSIQGTQISYGVIKAPADGVIASRNIELNENVSAGNVIAVLNAGTAINVEIGLPENVINEVQMDMDVTISFSSIKDNIFKGKVFAISPALDVSSATYPVKIHIVDETDAVKPGMAAEVTFDFGQDEANQKNSIIIPVKAVGEDTNGNFVFIIESEDGKVGIVKKQTITVGQLTTSGFEVISGLNEGERYATAGLQSLLDNQKVKLQ